MEKRKWKWVWSRTPWLRLLTQRRTRWNYFWKRGI